MTDNKLSMNNEPMAARWAILERRLGYHFKNRNLLTEALTHSSYANECQDMICANNERLEFLGDAVLGLAIGHSLFVVQRQASEGQLSRLRAELVSEPTLALLAKELGVGECLLLGRGETLSGGCYKESLLADCLEALMGAVFLDGGFKAVAKVVERVFAPLLGGTIAPAGLDYKTRLQELLQAHQRSLPHYRLTAASGPAHQRHYEVAVVIDGEVVGRGDGSTKKRAEQEAARHALLYCERKGTP